MHDEAIAELIAQTDTLLRRVDNLKQYLNLAEALAKEDPVRLHFLTTESRGSAIVGVCAELEALARTTLQVILQDLNRIGLQHCDVVPSLRQLAVHTTFESLRALSDSTKVWENREFTTTLETCREELQFPIQTSHPQPPLDGKTLKPEHFNLIWRVFSLPADPFPVITWRMTLQKISGLRNDIAHGNFPFFQIFQQAGTSKPDVERYLDDMCEFVINFTDTFERYLLDQSYLVTRKIKPSQVVN